MKLLQLLSDIFVLDSMNRELNIPIVLDKTDHYKEELTDLSLDHILVGSPYNERIAEDIEKYKFYSYKEYEDYLFPFYSAIFDRETKNGMDVKECVITTIPMHGTRYWTRGFDHMHHLAKRVSHEYDIPYISLLERNRYTPHQSSLSRENRLENVANSFRIKKYILLPKKILLLDDIISTGSTANEAARVLKSHGIVEVHGYFIASGK